jgi:hypothetical protein
MMPSSNITTLHLLLAPLSVSQTGVMSGYRLSMHVQWYLAEATDEKAMIS